MPDTRPDPGQLLARAQREQSRAGRGRLKVFFGMAPGVGKTYAMLNTAQRLAREGVDVVAGIVETHGRTETEQMLLGLDILPRQRIEYRGTTLEELDLGAAITRKPDIVLIDELAHTNAPGSRFEKRWQDVQECLRAGIGVFTTLNVQHLESLNDVVAQITGIPVRETVPDAVIEEADEIELVDLPPDALLERLKEGRVYLPESARLAADSFFRKGNLTALRELALRRTAQWVDAQMREYKQGHGIRAIWPVSERILVAVSPSPMSERLVRAAKRMAAGLHADLIAAYVETPRTANLPEADQERVVRTLRLAESLGAQTVHVIAENAALELISLARTRNVSKIVVGKTGLSRFREAVFGSFVNNLIRLSGDIDVYVVRGDSDSAGENAASAPRDWNAAEQSSRRGRRAGLLPYSLALGLVGACTAVATFAFRGLDLANIAMLYLAGVVITAVWLGRGPSVVAAVAGVVAFDVFFVPPRFSLAISDIQYLLTFAVMLATGLLIADLTTRLRRLADTARERERSTAALYAMTRELAAARGMSGVAHVAANHVLATFDADAAIAVSAQALPTGIDILASAGMPDWLDGADGRERGVARWAIDHGKAAGLGTQALPGSLGRYIPLTTTQGKIGVLALRPRAAESLLVTNQLLLLDTFANQIALALERVSLIEGQQKAMLEAESERLRSALLSSVSHDLRTPLAGIAGAASTLLESGGALDETTGRELTQSIVDESQRLNELIANLVFATRLEAGGIELRREWTTVEEIVGSGLARHRAALAQHPLAIRIPSTLPMLHADSAMLPQVVSNLIENALRYTPPGTPLLIAAWATEASINIKIADEGPGLADGESERVFQRFYRGRTARASQMGIDSAAPARRVNVGGGGGVGSGGGMGLGLTICQGIIKAHGGRIWAEPNLPRGVAFVFTLPLDQPQPSINPEEAPA